MGIASLILGIISFIISFIPACGFIIGFIPAIIGMTLGIISVSKNKVRKGVATIGTILSILALIIMVVMFIIVIFTSDTESTSNVKNQNNIDKKVEIKETNSQDEEKEIENKIEEEIENNTEESMDEIYVVADNISNNEVKNVNFGFEMIEELTNLGFTIEEATNMQSIFYKIGVNSLKVIDLEGYDSSEINNLYCFNAYANGDEEKQFYFTVDKREMFYAGYWDSTLYDTSKGGVLKNINDVHVPETFVDTQTYIMLQGKAEEAVKSCLTYPLTANFPLYNNWRIGRSDDLYKVIGTVKAKNGFGVESEMYFGVWFKKINNDFVVEGVEIDGIRVK